MCYKDSYLLADTLIIKETYNINTFVESGCYYGDTLDILKKEFKQLYSCDINEEYVRCSLMRVKRLNVEVVLMDGAEHLEHLYLNNKIGKTDFILYSDGHYFDSENKRMLTSELDELDVMIKYGLKPIIIYHDFKNPNYPKFQYDIFDVGDNDINLIKDKLDECYGVDEYELQYNTKTDLGVGYLMVIPNIYKTK